MKSLTGTFALMRFILKRDKISLLCWIFILPLLPVLSASAVAKLYTDAASLQTIVASVDANPMEVSMFAEYLWTEFGGCYVLEMADAKCHFFGIFNLFFVIKHTRGEEVSGRYELLSSTAIGRFAMISATLFLAFIANFLIGLCILLYLYAYGLPFAGLMALFLSAWGIGFYEPFPLLLHNSRRKQAQPKGIMGALLAIFYILNIVGNSGMDGGIMAFAD